MTTPSCGRKEIHNKGTKQEFKTTCNGQSQMTGNCSRTRLGRPRVQVQCLKCGLRFTTTLGETVKAYEARYGPIPVQFENGVMV